MISTSSKIAFGFILLISLLLGAIGYIYQEMNLLTEPSELEANINKRRKITNQIISQLYDMEIIGQTLRSGKIDEFQPYLLAMREAEESIDTLQTYLTDTLQQTRLDTVRGLLREKERNMIAVLEAMADSPTEELYQAELDSLLNKQDSLLRAPPRAEKDCHPPQYVYHPPQEKRILQTLGRGILTRKKRLHPGEQCHSGRIHRHHQRRI